MQAIKALVIGMGVLIVAGLALLGYGFYSQSDRLERRAGGKAAPAVATATTTATTTATAFGEVTVPLAPGARIGEVAAVGGRLAVRVAEPDGERLVILDPADGSVAGSFVLRAAPAVAPSAAPSAAPAAAPGAVPLR